MSLPGYLAICFVAAGTAAGAESRPADLHFASKVKPLIDSRCVSCHGPDKVKGGLRMDSREALLKGGETGPAIVPGKPKESLIVQAVTHAKADLGMPPKEKLTPGDIEVLEKWIADGAPWVTASTNVVADVAVASGERLGDAWSDPRNPIVRIFNGQRLDLWSFKPIRAPIPPKVKSKGWVRNPIDQFILARLAEKKLEPAPEASARTLARRVYLDLTGLPPTPEQLDAFLNDKRRDAYERLVDELLASSSYGEHWGRQWLDVIRYSDSNGFDWDEFRPKAWRFRDYVIRSFNADKPFNEFVREQLAGDELLEGAPSCESDQDKLIATGYLRMGPHDNAAPLFNEQDRSRAELMADLVETTGSAFLGMTMSCCRCHDHKYDPISHADHFRMRSFFEPVKFADDLPLNFPDEQKAIREHNAGIDAKLKAAEATRNELVKEIRAELRAKKVAELSEQDRAILEDDRAKQSDELKKKAEELEKKVQPEEKELVKALPEEKKKRHGELTAEIDAIKKQKREFLLGLLMTDGDGDPKQTRVLFQGNHKMEREPVVPGFLSALDPNPAEILKPINPKTKGRRLTLANWIVSTNNPLTARVFVNRVWQGHFGKGLVETANDFGLAGAKPTHPELLDWLASELVRNGWSMKALHKLVVTSATYRQAAVASPKRGEAFARIDGENQFLWRQNLRRVSAEQLRDSLMFVSGTLGAKQGGPSVWPELPAEVLQANPAFLDDNAEKTKGWYPSKPEERNVRSVYMIQKRTVRVPLMETFDLPENSISCARRNESIVAPQALSLLNGTDALQAARSLATRVEKEAKNPTEQIELAFRYSLQRKPGAAERSACAELLQKRSLVEFCRVLLNVNEFVYID